MQSHKLTVQRTAHYYTVGTPGPHIKYFWLITHGYGEVANEFIDKFKVLEREDTFILAPEGLNKFYWGGGFTGKPVATWMTKHVRLDEIADYSNYLQQLYDQYVPQMSPTVKITLLGFSQGTATQVRWIMNKFPKYHDLILYSGLLPEDLEYTPHLDFFNNKRMLFTYGDQDRFLTSPRVDWQKGFAKEQGLNLTTRSFEGKHKIMETELEVLNEWIRS